LGDQDLDSKLLCYRKIIKKNQLRMKLLFFLHVLLFLKDSNNKFLVSWNFGG